MRGLFITHVHGPYGATRSLQLLTRHIEGVEITLVLPRERRRWDRAALRAEYGQAVREVRERFLPFEYCYLGSPNLFKLLARNRLRNWIWRMAARRLDAEMRTGGFDFIHLNSAVLNPLVAPDLPFIIHTREYVCRPGARTMERFGHARGVIFIDEGTREPFRDVSLSHWTVLSNPVDMTPLRQGYTLEAAQQHYQVGADNVVFTALGRIDENKGIAFLIDSFRRVPDPRFILLVVGAGVPGDPCEEECRRLAAGDSRIRFAGEQADPMPVYLISDYVMRGESRHLVGRTMIEGLYAGCHLIVPGTPEETSRTPELAAAYPDRVHLYPPRDGTALAGLIAGLTRKAGDRSFRSNALEYARAFMAFVREVTGRGNGVAAVPAAG